MTVTGRIRQIATESIVLGRRPIDCPTFRSNLTFGRRHSHEIWLAIGELRAGKDPDQPGDIINRDESEDDAEECQCQCEACQSGECEDCDADPCGDRITAITATATRTEKTATTRSRTTTPTTNPSTLTRPMIANIHGTRLTKE